MDIEDLLRTDGRLPSEFRNIHIHVELVEKTPHLIFKSGCTEVEVALDTPSSRSPLAFNISFLEMARADPISDKRLYELRAKLLEIFSDLLTVNYPVALQIIVKYDDGGLVPAIVNAITIFLCYSGIAIRDMYFSVCRGEFSDLSLAELNRGFALTTVYSSTFKEIVYLESLGACTPTKMIETIHRSTEDCEHVKRIASRFLYGTLENV